MMKNGLDPDVLDGDPDKPSGTNSVTICVPLKDDPVYARYLRCSRSAFLCVLRSGRWRRMVSEDGDHTAPAGSAKKA